MPIKAPIKSAVFASLTAIGGLVIGILIFLRLETNSDSRPKPVSRLIRELQKQDSAFSRTHQALWSALPDFVTRRLSALEPRDAVQIRRIASIELINRGPEARIAVAALIAALNDPEREVRRNAVLALTELGPLADTALPDLIRSFKESSAGSTNAQQAQSNRETALALAAIGPHDLRVITLLSDALVLLC